MSRIFTRLDFVRVHHEGPPRSEPSARVRWILADEIARQHGVMPGGERDDDGRILRALRLVNRRRIGWNQGVELPERIRDLATVEARHEKGFIVVDARDRSEIAIEHIAIVIILGLHERVARREDRAEFFHSRRWGGIESLLQLDIERSRPERAARRRAAHLNVADRGRDRNAAECGHERFRRPRPLPSRDLRRRRTRHPNPRRALRQFRHFAAIDSVGVAEDAALGRLPQHCGRARPIWRRSRLNRRRGAENRGGLSA